MWISTVEHNLCNIFRKEKKVRGLLQSYIEIRITSDASCLIGDAQIHIHKIKQWANSVCVTLLGTTKTSYWWQYRQRRSLIEFSRRSLNLSVKKRKILLYFFSLPLPSFSVQLKFFQPNLLPKGSRNGHANIRPNSHNISKSGPCNHSTKSQMTSHNGNL